MSVTAANPTSVTAVTDDPPDDVLDQIHRLGDALDQEIPAKTLDRNLLIATWNLRAFGDLTQSWHSGPHDSPKRDLTSIRCIAEVLRRFDVIAVQEIRGDLKCLRETMRALGPDWGFLLTDVTKGMAGNDERLAFVFDLRRVKPSGLAGELVLPDVGGSPVRQFARTPYAVSFVSGTTTFILVTVHIMYGDSPADRIPELQAIAAWMADWAKAEASWGHNLLVLGDFNIEREKDPLFEAFTSTGLTTPTELSALSRTIFDHPTTPHFYDQIAWFTGQAGTPALSLGYQGKAGRFDFVPHVMTDLTPTELSWRISDHYPLWVEFVTR